MQLRNFAERTALNSPLQGTAADLIKLAMIAIRRAAGEGEAGVADDFAGARRIVVRGCRKKEKGKLEKLVKEEMEGVHKLIVPLVVEMGTGANWRDLE